MGEGAGGGEAPGARARAPGAPDAVVVHPLVLLSVVDHYNRVARDSKKRVVGVLLGETSKGQVHVTNSYAGARRPGRGRRGEGGGGGGRSANPPLAWPLEVSPSRTPTTRFLE